jgi:hypothetical protein
VTSSESRHDEIDSFANSPATENPVGDSFHIVVSVLTCRLSSDHLSLKKWLFPCAAMKGEKCHRERKTTAGLDQLSFSIHVHAYLLS